jgi:hypothetical protein
MTRGKSTPPPGGFLSGLAALIVMLALAAAGGGAFLLFDRGAQLEAEALFALVMDLAAGAGNWERGPLTRGFLGATITVENLVVRPRDLEINDRFTAGKVVITRPMDDGEARRLSYLRDWIGQPRTVFAEEVAITGVSSGRGNVAAGARSILIRRPALAEAGRGNLPGPAGFLLSLAAEAVAVEGLDGRVVDADEFYPDTEYTLSASLFAIDGLDQGRLDPRRPPWAAFMERFRLGRLRVGGLRAGSRLHRDFHSLSLGELSVTGVGHLKVAEVLFRGADWEAVLHPEGEARARLGEFSVKGLDLGPLIDRLGGGGGWEPALADFVTPPFGLDSVSLAGLSLDGPHGLALSLAGFSSIGPYGPGRLPPKSSITLNALTLTAPDPPLGDVGKEFRQLYQLMGTMGVGSLTFFHSKRCLYEEPPGRYACRYEPVLGERSLGDLNYSFSVTGLTPSAIKLLGAIPAHNVNPRDYDDEIGRLLSGLGLEEITVDLANRALVDLLLGLKASETGQSRDQAAANLLDAFDRYAADHLAGGGARAAAALRAFSREPRRLVLAINPAADARPQPPLPVDAPTWSAEALNGLGLTLAVNDEAPIGLRFR